MADESPPQEQQPQEQQPQEQQFYRQYLQSTAPDGSSTIREIVSPNLLDHDAAAAAEQKAGYTFSGFVDPSKMAGVRTAAAPPPPAADATPLLASDVAPTSGGAPTSYSAAPPPPGPWAQWQSEIPDRVTNPNASPWLNVLPPALSVAAPMALAAVQPEIGIPWLMAASAFGGGTGEAAREKLAGEQLSPRDIATQGAVSGLTEGGAQVAMPYVMAAARGGVGQIAPTLGAVEELGPVLGSKDAAATAAPTVTTLAGEGANTIRSNTEPAFNAARVSGRGLPVHTAGLDPHVDAATNAVAQAGATPAQVAEFETVVSPMRGGEPGDYVQLMGRERQLENWISGMKAQGADASHVAPLEALHKAVGGQIDAAAAGTPAAPMRAQYTAVQGEQLPARYALSDLQANPNLAAQNPATIQALAKQAADADRPALAAAWVDSARQAAAASRNPVLAMRVAYDNLGAETQTALFGAEKGAFERVLQTAWGGTGEEWRGLLTSAGIGSAGVGAGGHFGIPFRIPGASLATARGALDLATPFVAREALVRPEVARFGARVSRLTGEVVPVATRVGAQLYGERARQAGLPRF